MLCRRPVLYIQIDVHSAETNQEPVPLPKIKHSCLQTAYLLMGILQDKQISMLQQCQFGQQSGCWNSNPKLSLHQHFHYVDAILRSFSIAERTKVKFVFTMCVHLTSGASHIL